MSDVLTVACPLCSSPPGRDCINTTSGKPFTGFVHRERHAAHRASQRADWKAAKSARAKDARNRRGKRPAPEPSGYVKEPE